MIKNYRSGFEELTEIKKGKTGTGLLIENDGHIIGNTDTISQIKEDIKNGHEFVCPDHFVVSAVFQKYGIKNANGRIYPESVLKREVERYIKEKINNRCALGSLDHPSCQLADTQILTEKGWLYIPEVKVGDKIMTLKENDDIEVNEVIRKIEEPYKGKMYHITGRFIDITVTPNHKFPVYDRFKKFKGLYTAQEIFEGKVPDMGHSYIPKTGNWTAVSDEFFTVESLTTQEIEKIPQKILKEKYAQNIQIPMEVWMKFMGIYLSEGCVSGVDRICIFQRKKEICDEIEEMLEEFPLEYSKFEKISLEDNKPVYTYNIYDMRLCKYLKPFGKCYDKYVPYEIKKQGKDMLRIFYDWFVMGDGRKRGIGPGNYYSDDVFSTSKQLVMDLNEIQFKIGYCGSYHEENRQFDRMMGKRLIKGENSKNMHFSFRQHNKFIILQRKSLKIEEIDYDGMVYCVEVKNHTFYTMCKNGKCLWSGNSSSLSGHDVSHNILNLEWQGRTLVGELELQLSPGYKRYGICSTSGDLVANMLLSNYLIGVSSRGVGSVKQAPGGVMVVDDDYEIICWDVVLEPSTPNAYIKSSEEELQPFIESEVKNGTLLSEKIGKIEKLLY